MSINASNLYKVFTVHPQKDGRIERHYVGKYLLHDGQIEILEDHHGILVNSLHEGAVTAETLHTLEAMKDSPYIDVVSQHELDSGKRPEYYEEADLGDAPDPLAEQTEADQKVLHSDGRPDRTPMDQPVASNNAPFPTGPAIFYCYRQGIPDPDVLEVNGQQAWLNGSELNHGEIATVLANVRTGIATLRYKKIVDSESTKLHKMEIMLKGDLSKALDDHLTGALKQLREAAKAGHIHPDHLRSITQHIFQDDMIPHMGNRKAYSDFASRPKQGVHIRMDGNDFGQINKVHGFEAGNHAIKAMGGALQAAMKETAGHKRGKTFRIGGDEFHAFIPDYEDAVNFTRAARKHLESIPAIGGTHGLSLSIGMGHSPEHAEKALIHAKTAKKQQNYPIGGAKTHVHSLVPGKEGAVPVDANPAPLTPTAPVVKPTAPTPQIHLNAAH
jgi:GGDEF domain-containing protein